MLPFLDCEYRFIIEQFCPEKSGKTTHPGQPKSHFQRSAGTTLTVGPIPCSRALLCCNQDRARATRKLLRIRPSRHELADRSAGRRHHLRDHGLHHLRQPVDSARGRIAVPGCGSRHLPDGRFREHSHGGVRPLSPGAGPRHGPECVLHLHRRPGHAHPVAGCPGRGVPIGCHVSRAHRCSASAG